MKKKGRKESMVEINRKEINRENKRRCKKKEVKRGNGQKWCREIESREEKPYQ